MSFDPVSYLMGKESGGGGGSSVTVEPLTVTENGTYTAPEGEAFSPVTVLVQNSFSADDEGKVVVNRPDVGDNYYVLDAQTEHATVTSNGTYDTTTNNSVTVNVPQGYTGFETVTGTIDYPWGNNSFADVLSRLAAFTGAIGASAWMLYDAAALGMGSGVLTLFPDEGDASIFGSGAIVDASSSMAVNIRWDATGLVSAYIEQNGTITDLYQYAALVTTTLYGPTDGGAT